MIRGRLATLYRRLYPAGLAREWTEVMVAICGEGGLLCRLDPSYRPPDEVTLRQWAREGAATGKRPGDVLAQMLAELYGRAA